MTDVSHVFDTFVFLFLVFLCHLLSTNTVITLMQTISVHKKP